MRRWLVLLVSIFIFFGCSSQELSELSTLYKEREYEKVIKQGKELIGCNKSSNDVYILIARAFIDQKKYTEAVGILEQINVSNNAKVSSWYYACLGESYLFLGDYEKSKKLLEKAISLPGSRLSHSYASRRLHLLELNKCYKDWTKVVTKHVIFHFQKKYEEEKLQWFVSTRLRALDSINVFFKASLNAPIDFYVWDNKKDAKTVLKRELGFAQPEFSRINSYKKQTRGHELTHLLCDYGIRPIVKSLLINEGVAVFFDQTTRNRIDVAKASIKGDRFSLLDLWKYPKKYPLEWNYTVGGAFIGYLKEVGTEVQLKKLLKNQSYEAALVIYPNLNQLIADFEELINS